MLGGKKDLAVACERLLEGAHAGLAAYHEGHHHVRKDHHVPEGHHGQLARFGFFAGCSHWVTWSIRRAKTASGFRPAKRVLLELYSGMAAEINQLTAFPMTVVARQPKKKPGCLTLPLARRP